MTELLAGLLGAVRLRQPWMGAACLVVVAALAASLWIARTRHLTRRRQLVVPLAGLALGLAGWWRHRRMNQQI